MVVPRPSLGRLMGYGALLAMLSGCAVGPNFTPPAPPVAQGYAGPGDKAAPRAVLTADTGPAGPWWQALGSRDLDEVMTYALAHNQTVAAAQATLEKARAQAQHENAGRYPVIGLGASYQRERINIAALGFSGFPSPTLGLYSIGPTVNYDFDFAGGQRRRVEAARAQAEAQAFRADAAYLTLTGNVALQAVKIAGGSAEIETLQAIAVDDRKSIDIVAKAEAAGGEPRTAGLGGKLQLEQDVALLPPLADQLAQARHALALLVGEAPSEWKAPDFKVSSFTPPDAIPVALPSTLVRQRPDIRAAESDLHADTAMIGVQTARLYPDVRLVGSVTQEAVNPNNLSSTDAAAYNFGPELTYPIFDGGAIRADRRAAQAQARISLARYRQTVLTAFVQVSDVLSALAQDEERLASDTRAEATAKASLDDAREAYRLGGGPLSNVVVADRRWRQASLAKLQATAQRLLDIVDLFAATAADWQSARTAQNQQAPKKVLDGADVKSLAPPNQSP